MAEKWVRVFVKSFDTEGEAKEFLRKRLEAGDFGRYQILGEADVFGVVKWNVYRVEEAKPHWLFKDQVKAPLRGTLIPYVETARAKPLTEWAELKEKKETSAEMPPQKIVIKRVSEGYVIYRDSESYMVMASYGILNYLRMWGVEISEEEYRRIKGLMVGESITLGKSSSHSSSVEESVKCKLHISAPAEEFVKYERQRMVEAGAKYFLKAQREGDYFYHMTTFGALKKILAEGVIKADRHQRGTVSFTTHPLRYISAFGGPLLPVNDCYIKVHMSLVPNAFPVVYWLTEEEAEELSPEIKAKLIPIERFDELIAEYGPAWSAYKYPFIWAAENEWRVLGNFMLPWKKFSVGVSSERQKRYVERMYGELAEAVFVDEDLAKILAKK
ncbi:MAG: hypothetical protein QXO67_02745 [Candidatus Bathyarchaeia archaeon]